MTPPMTLRTDAALDALGTLDEATQERCRCVPAGPRCPSCKAEDSLLVLALESRYLRAMEALYERPDSEHDRGCSAGFSKLPCKCSQKDRVAVLDALADAILEPEEEKPHA